MYGKGKERKGRKGKARQGKAKQGKGTVPYQLLNFYGTCPPYVFSKLSV